MNLIITIAAGFFGIYILVKQDLSLIPKYGYTLIILGVIGILMTSLGTLFSTRGDHADIHNKNLDVLYFIFVIIFGAATLYKGEEFINMVSKTIM